MAGSTSGENSRAIKIAVMAIINAVLYLLGRPLISRLIGFFGLSKTYCYCISAVVAVIIAMCMIRKKDAREYGLNHGEYKGNLRYVIPMLFLGVTNVPYIFLGTFGNAVVRALFCVAYVGVMEELIFRGYVYRAIELRFGENKAIVLSSIVFGLFHLVNLTGNTPVFFTLLQVVYAAMLGLMLAVLRSKTKSIYPGMLIHALFNLISEIFAGYILWVDVPGALICCVVGIVYYIDYRKKQIPAND